MGRVNPVVPPAGPRMDSAHEGMTKEACHEGREVKVVCVGKRKGRKHPPVVCGYFLL